MGGLVHLIVTHFQGITDEIYDIMSVVLGNTNNFVYITTDETNNCTTASV